MLVHQDLQKQTLSHLQEMCRTIRSPLSLAKQLYWNQKSQPLPDIHHILVPHADSLTRSNRNLYDTQHP